MRPRSAPRTSSTTVATLVAATVAALVYLWIRVSTTIGGADPVLAGVLLLAEAALIVGSLVTMVPIAVFSIGGKVGAPSPDPLVDVVVVLRDERLLDLRLALRACRELRGRDGVVVVGGEGRRGVESVCRSFGVPRLDHRHLVGLGTEVRRPAPYVLIVPASAWVAPDAAAVLSPALAADDVGAVAGRTVVHGVVDLLGSAGYRLEIDREGALADHLDGTGCAPPGDGPLLVRKAAAAAVGGFDWSAPRPELDIHTRLRQRGWTTRSVRQATAFRMAPTDESRALEDRGRRLRAWQAAASAAAATQRSGQTERAAPGEMISPPGRRRWWSPERIAFVEAAAAVPRLVLLFFPLIVAVTGRAPLSLDRPGLLGAAAASWFVTSSLARRRIAGPQVRFSRMRAGLRTLGVDLTMFMGGARPDRRGRVLQYTILASLLVSIVVATLSLTSGVGGLTRWERIATGAAIVVIAVLVRDASTAYRQQRQLPRVHCDDVEDGEVTDLSPTGFAVASLLEVGSTRTTDIDLPYPDGRVETVTVKGTVRATRRQGGRPVSFIEIETDHETFEKLIYFCAVTAPTIARLDGSDAIQPAHRDHPEITGSRI